jgi:hypothetical protein
MRPNGTSRATQRHVTCNPTATDVSLNGMSRVGANGISRVTQRQVTCGAHVRCRLSTDIKHCITSTGLSSSALFLQLVLQHSRQQVPPLARRALVSAVVAVKAKTTTKIERANHEG